MKVKVIKDKCIGCGNCVALSEGQIFDFNDDGLAETIVDVVPIDMEETAKDAIIQCPTEAITEVTEEKTSVSDETIIKDKEENVEDNIEDKEENVEDNIEETSESTKETE